MNEPRRPAPRHVPPVPRQPLGRNLMIVFGVHVIVISMAAISLKSRFKDAPEISGGGHAGSAPAPSPAEEVRWINPALEKAEPFALPPAAEVAPKDEPASDIVLTSAKTEPAPVPEPEVPKPALKPPDPVPAPKPAPKPVVAATPPPKPKPAPAPAPEVKLRPVEKKPELPKPKPVEPPKMATVTPAPALKPAPAPALRPAPKMSVPPPPPSETAVRAKPIAGTAANSTSSGSSTGSAPTLRAVPISTTGTGQGNGTGAGIGMGNGSGQGNGNGSGVGNGARAFGDILGEYHTRVYEAFHEEWLPPGAIITAGRTYRVKTEIVIARDGKIMDAKIVQSSGHAEMDLSVQQALRRVFKIEPLPAFIQGESYRVILNFDL